MVFPASLCRILLQRSRGVAGPRRYRSGPCNRGERRRTAELALGWKKVGTIAALAAAVLALGVFRPGTPQDTEAALNTPGGITAAPSAIPGLPAVTDQVIPVLAPASGP